MKLLLFACLSLAIAPFSHGQNLILNPDFAIQGTGGIISAEDWTPLGPPGNAARNFNVLDDTWQMTLTVTGPSEAQIQSIQFEVEANETYDLNFLTKLEVTPVAADIQYLLKYYNESGFLIGGPIFVPLSGLNFTYSNYSSSFTVLNNPAIAFATFGVRVATGAVEGAQATLSLTDVSVTSRAIPEPGTFVLLALGGLGGLILWRRHRRPSLA